MQRTPPWLALLWLLCPLAAQDQPAPKPEKTEAAKRLEQLDAEQNDLFKAWMAKVDAQEKAAALAKAEGKPIPAMPGMPDFGALQQKYLAAAKAFPGEDAVPFLLATLNLGGIDAAASRQVWDELLDHHLDSPKLTAIGGLLPHLGEIFDADYAASAIRRIEKDGKNQSLLGWAAFARFAPVLRSAAPASPAFRDAKIAVAAAVQKAGDMRLQHTFEALVAEQEKFGLGMTAPDIHGVDLDGVAFKLSDYQGKVVLLDFWGDW